VDKLGLHIVEGFSGNLGKPRLVKLVDASAAYVAQVRDQVGPDCLIIVRWVEEQPLDNPEKRAEEWFCRHRQAMLDMKKAAGPEIAFEGYNEIPDHQADAYDIFEQNRLIDMRDYGLRAVAGNFSVGTPDLPTWAKYEGMLHCIRDGHMLGLHEYWSSRNDLSNPWHVGRWRLVPELASVPIVVTECGRDVVEGQGAAGWKQTASAEEFLGDLRQYSALLAEFPRVKGGCVFTGGRIYPQWRDFEVNSIWERVIMEQKQVSPQPQPGPDQPTPPKPDPVPDPRPVVGIPLIDEIRLPIVNLHKAWYEASVVYGPYDQHPNRAQDWNLETGGNTDLGEPLVAPFNGLVVHAAQYGGGYGKCVGIVGLTPQGEMVCWQGRHLHTMTVQAGQIVWAGDPIGSIGNADGRYAGAHLHEQICVGEVPGALQDWQNVRYNYVQPSEWYIAHGVDRGLVERMRKYDKR
jgi:hypothetical protein